MAVGTRGSAHPVQEFASGHVVRECGASLPPGIPQSPALGNNDFHLRPRNAFPEDSNRRLVASVIGACKGVSADSADRQ